MPLDSTGFIDPALLPDFKFKLGHDRLRQLADLLRKEEEWKARTKTDFVWDYFSILNPLGKPESPCGYAGCALGLAAMVWPKEFLDQNGRICGSYKIAMLFGIRPVAVDAIFFGKLWLDADLSRQAEFRVYMPWVRPGDVADRIDEYLEHGTVTWPESVCAPLPELL